MYVYGFRIPVPRRVRTEIAYSTRRLVNINEDKTFCRQYRILVNIEVILSCSGNPLVWFYTTGILYGGNIYSQNYVNFLKVAFRFARIKNYEKSLVYSLYYTKNVCPDSIIHYTYCIKRIN